MDTLEANRKTKSQQKSQKIQRRKGRDFKTKNDVTEINTHWISSIAEWKCQSKDFVNSKTDQQKLFNLNNRGEKQIEKKIKSFRDL